MRLSTRRIVRRRSHRAASFPPAPGFSPDPAAAAWSLVASTLLPRWVSDPAALDRMGALRSRFLALAALQRRAPGLGHLAVYSVDAQPLATLSLLHAQSRVASLHQLVMLDRATVDAQGLVDRAGASSQRALRIAAREELHRDCLAAARRMEGVDWIAGLASWGPLWNVRFFLEAAARCGLPGAALRLQILLCELSLSVRPTSGGATRVSAHQFETAAGLRLTVVEGDDPRAAALRLPGGLRPDEVEAYRQLLDLPRGMGALTARFAAHGLSRRRRWIFAEDANGALLGGAALDLVDAGINPLGVFDVLRTWRGPAAPADWVTVQIGLLDAARQLTQSLCPEKPHISFVDEDDGQIGFEGLGEGDWTSARLAAAQSTLVTRWGAGPAALARFGQPGPDHHIVGPGFHFGLRRDHWEALDAHLDAVIAAERALPA